MKNYILALDQGTTSSRAILFDRSGMVVAVARKEFKQYYPHPGWVEHDPREIMESQITVAREVLDRNGISAASVAAIGITNQRETTILWDRTTGAPVFNAIVWQDRRTADFCETLRNRGYEALVHNKCGLVIDAYFSGTKLRWLLENVPGAREKAEAGILAFGTVDSWLVWNLTGGRAHVTDTTNASRTMLFDINRLEWDGELLSLMDIPAPLMPQVVSSSEVYGETDPAFFGTAIPIAGIAGDQQAALFGQVCLKRGMIKNTYGTGAFVMMHTGARRVQSRNNLLTTVALTGNGTTAYAMEGSIFVAGAVVQWLRDGLGIIKKSEDIEPLALSVPDNGGIVLVPALTGLGAPHWNPYARGTISGITRGTTAGHIARAALEGIAFQVHDVVSAMIIDSAIEAEELRVDGGAASNDTLLQFQADILGIPVVRPVVSETTALGAASLAGLAVGFYSGIDELETNWKKDRVFYPSTDSTRTRESLNAWRRALAGVACLSIGSPTGNPLECNDSSRERHNHDEQR
ncbi:MAG: glycerol kinase GlpK [Syntrophales bacterium]|jgi:glycerol kinase|nr:glycerol kinase GlpK [Syntrophales bacterium]MCK9527190.1 glycerol kinase GlpK [Syntrophales bacterium]MDX9921685.1 glycerol kinase GlpK [Syntrophales bacterium]